jgi:phospholipase C
LKGEEFATTIIAALMQSKYWKNSVFILTYGSSGGWYDHVSPPQSDNNELGFRVPTIIISPYAKQGFIDSNFYDSTSILKFIEYNNNLSLLNTSELKSNNILNSFDFKTGTKNTNKIVTDLIDEYKSRMFESKEQDKIENIYFIFILNTIIVVSIPIVYFSSRYLSHRNGKNI